jgi:hypothetical protein
MHLQHAQCSFHPAQRIADLLVWIGWRCAAAAALVQARTTPST